MKISELNEDQRQHLIWRLDAKTCCGLLTAGSISRGEKGDLDLVDIFMEWGCRNKRSALAHARLVEIYVVDEEKREAADASFQISMFILGRTQSMTLKQVEQITKNVIASCKSNLEMKRAIS